MSKQCIGQATASRTVNIWVHDNGDKHTVTAEYKGAVLDSVVLGTFDEARLANVYATEILRMTPAVLSDVLVGVLQGEDARARTLAAIEAGSDPDGVDEHDRDGKPLSADDGRAVIARGRAESAIAALIGEGIDGNRFDAVGLGEVLADIYQAQELTPAGPARDLYRAVGRVIAGRISPLA